MNARGKGEFYQLLKQNLFINLIYFVRQNKHLKVVNFGSLNCFDFWSIKSLIILK